MLALFQMLDGSRLGSTDYRTVARFGICRKHCAFWEPVTTWLGATVSQGAIQVPALASASVRPRASRPAQAVMRFSGRARRERVQAGGGAEQLCRSSRKRLPRRASWPSTLTGRRDSRRHESLSVGLGKTRPRAPPKFGAW